MKHPRSFKPRPDKHKTVSGKEADDNCPTIGGFVMIECEDCGVRYAIHCPECQQQLTNCSCTLDHMTKRHGEENTRQAEEDEWLKEKGLWVPPSAR